MSDAFVDVDAVRSLVDASAPGLAPADVAIVFGSTLPGPVDAAARVLRDRLAPLVVLTGGPNRRMPQHVESEAHAALLRAAGVPDEFMVLERESTTTVGNVDFARPLMEARCGPVHTVIAIVKWWHRRALHVLAAGMPSVQRIYAVT